MKTSIGRCGVLILSVPIAVMACSSFGSSRLSENVAEADASNDEFVGMALDAGETEVDAAVDSEAAVFKGPLPHDTIDGVPFFDCTNRRCKDIPTITCPAGKPCLIRCSGNLSCNGTFYCASGQRCAVECVDPGSCQGLKLVAATATSLCVRCLEPGSCNSPLTCETTPASCAVECATVAACTTPSGCGSPCWSMKCEP